VIIPRGPKNFLKKWHFLAKKVKNFFKKAILGRGRVAFNKNFIGGRGYFKPHPPPIPPTPKLMYGYNCLFVSDGASTSVLQHLQKAKGGK
jgi:hypothetical protein